MTYQEAEKKSLQVRWKTSTCPSGKKCWCRILEPEDKITVKSEALYIVGSGCIPKVYAEHIVALHNHSIAYPPNGHKTLNIE